MLISWLLTSSTGQVRTRVTSFYAICWGYIFQALETSVFPKSSTNRQCPATIELNSLYRPQNRVRSLKLEDPRLEWGYAVPKTSINRQSNQETVNVQTRHRWIQINIAIQNDRNMKGSNKCDVATQNVLHEGRQHEPVQTTWDFDTLVPRVRKRAEWLIHGVS